MKYAKFITTLAAVIVLACAPGFADSEPKEVFIPYRDLSTVISPSSKIKLMERDEFAKLLADAKRNAGGGESIARTAIVSAQYDTSVDADRAEITGELTIRSLTDNPLIVPLDFGDIGLTDIRLNGKTAQLGLDDTNKLRLIVTGRGDHKLTLRGSAKLHEKPAGMTLIVVLPKSVAGVMNVTATGDMDMQSFSPVSKRTYDKKTDRTTAVLSIAQYDPLVVVFSGNGKQENSSAVLLGDIQEIVQIGQADQSLNCLASVMVLRRGVRELDFTLPKGWTVTEVSSDNMVKWSAAPSQKGQKLTVTLLKARQGQQAVQIKALMPRKGVTWNSPMVQLDGATFSRAYLCVDVGENLRVRSEEISNAQRENVATAPVFLRDAGSRLYTCWGDAWNIRLTLAEVKLRQTCDAIQVFQIDTEKISLDGKFKITAQGRQLYDIQFTLPPRSSGFELLSNPITVNGSTGGFEYNVSEKNSKRVLTIQLARPVEPESSAEVRVAMQCIPDSWRWQDKSASRKIEMMRIVSHAQKIKGLLSVVSCADLAVKVDSVTKGLLPVPVGRMAGLGLASDVQNAYRYVSEGSTNAGKLTISRQTGRVACNAVGLLTVSPGKLAGKWRLNYDITRASMRELKFMAAKTLGRQINITVPGRRMLDEGTILPDEKAQAAGYNVWLLKLESPVMGRVSVDISFEQSIANKDATVPLIRPVTAQSDELLAIQVSDEIAVALKTSAVREIDTVDLPPLPGEAGRLIAAYQLAPPESPKQSSISLQTTVYGQYDIPAAFVLNAKLLTLVGGDGSQQTQATYSVVNAGMQFLRVSIPKNAELWSINTNGIQVRPQCNNSGEYLIPLKLSSRTQNVTVVYAVPATGKIKDLKLCAASLGDIITNDVCWEVVPPAGYHISSADTSMQPEYMEKTSPAYEKVFSGAVELLGYRGLLGPSMCQAKRFSPQELMCAEPTEETESGSDDSSYVGYESLEDNFDDTENANEPAQSMQQQARGVPIYNLSGRIEGRYTLPVSLKNSMATGNEVIFSGLGESSLCVNITKDSYSKAWSFVGFAAVLLGGLLLLRRKWKNKAWFVMIVLGVSTLLGVWLPCSVHVANGAFYAAVCMAVFYVGWAGLRFMLRVLLNLRRSLLKKSLSTAVVIIALSLSSNYLAAESPNLFGDTIIPYDGNPTKAQDATKVLLPYDRYVELWNQAHPKDRIELPAPVGVSLGDIKYAAVIDGDKFALTLTADVRTYHSSPQMLPMTFTGLAITSAEFNGQAAQLQNSSNATMLMLPGKSRGILKITAAGTCKLMGQKGSVDFMVPPLPGGVMTVKFPAETDLSVPSLAEPVSHAKLDSGDVLWTIPLRSTRRVRMLWMPKVGTGNADKTLTAAVHNTICAKPWAILGDSDITFNMTAGQSERFALLIPAKTTIINLDGENIRDFGVIATRELEGEKYDLLEIRLQRPATKSCGMHLSWIAPLLSMNRTSRLELPKCADVARESGSVSLFDAGGVDMKVEKTTGGRRANLVSKYDPSVSPVARFTWPYRPFEIFVKLSRIAVKSDVRVNQLVRISPEESQLFIDAELTAKEGNLFGASFMLPRDYELTSVTGPAVEDWYARSTPAGQRLDVNFRKAVKTVRLALAMNKTQPQLAGFKVPVVTVLDSDGKAVAKQPGCVAVQLSPSMDAETLQCKNLKSVVPYAMRAWLELPQIPTVRFAYDRTLPDFLLKLKIVPKPTRIRVEEFVGITVRSTAAAYTYLLRYDISGSPVDHVSFSLSDKYASLVAVDSPLKRSVTSKKLADGSTQWTLWLQNEVTGTLDVTANFALPIDDQTSRLPVPPVRTLATNGYKAVVAVRNLSRHDISLGKTAKLNPMPVNEQTRELPPSLRSDLLYIFRTFDEGWQMSMNFKPAPAAMRVQAVIDLMAMTTVISPNGQCRYEVALTLQNRSEQFLHVVLPKGLSLWSAVVADKPVKPVIPDSSAAGEVLIPMVKTSPGGLPYDVKLYLGGQVVQKINGLTKLAPPAVKIKGIGVMRTTWSLRLPRGYRYMAMEGNMSSVAGEAEIMSIGIDAKIEQFQRMSKAYDSIGGSGRKKEIARMNIETFQKGVQKEIDSLERYVSNNRSNLSDKDYHRMQMLIGGQKAKAREELRQVTAAINKSDANQGDLNKFLNDSSQNNRGINAARATAQPVPGFLQQAGEKQLQALRKELMESDVKKDYALKTMEESRKKAEKPWYTTIKYPREAPENKMKAEKAEVEVMKMSGNAPIDLEQGQAVANMATRRRKVAKQLQQAESNYYYGKRSEGKTSQFANGFQPSSNPQPVMKPGTYAPAPELPKGGRARIRTSGAAKLGTAAKAQNDITQSQWSQTTPAAPSTPQPSPYVATGTFSLPMTLPEGEINLDYAMPGSGAQLSIYAVPVGWFDDLRGTAAVIVSLFIFGLVLLCIRRVKSSGLPSIRRMLGVLALAVIITIVCGTIGLGVFILLVLAVDFIKRRRAQAQKRSTPFCSDRRKTNPSRASI